MAMIPNGQRRDAGAATQRGAPRAAFDGFSGEMSKFNPTGAPPTSYTLDSANARGGQLDSSADLFEQRGVVSWCISCGTPESLCVCRGRAYSSTSLRMADLVNASGGGLAPRRASGSFAFKGERE